MPGQKRTHYRELIKIPRFAQLKCNDWTDHEKLILCIMLLAAREDRWDTCFHLRLNDFQQLGNYHRGIKDWETILEKLRRVMTIGILSETTVTLQFKEELCPPRGRGHKLAQGEVYITDFDAICKYWYLAGKIRKGEMLSEHNEAEPLFSSNEPQSVHSHFNRLRFA